MKGDGTKFHDQEQTMIFIVLLLLLFLVEDRNNFHKKKEKILEKQIEAIYLENHV